MPTDAAQAAPSNGIGDIDADGFPDFAIGLARANALDGMVELRSGRTGAVPGRLHGDPGAAGSFGASMAGIADGDGNRDGSDEFMIGSLLEDRNGGQRSARLDSGLDGSLVQLIRGDATSGVFGLGYAAAGDVDQDGFGDVFVTEPRVSSAGSLTGALHP